MAKDCDCINHEGPHWRYLDRLDRARTEQMLKDGNVRGAIVNELARLREKRWAMQSGEVPRG